MDVITSRLAHLEEQARLQATSIALLVAKEEVHTFALAHLSSEVARLSSLNDSKDVFIRQLEAKVFSEGFWIWEQVGDGLSGRWAWSKDNHRNPPPSNRIGPPTSLLSLPNELLEIILSLALPKRRDRIQPLSVCFRFLEVLSPMAYRTVELRSPSAAIRFVLPRIPEPNPLTTRVSSLLTPQMLLLSRQDGHADFSLPAFLPLTLLADLPDHPSILLPNLIIEDAIREIPLYALIDWAPLLRVLNPEHLALLSVEGAALVPTACRVSSDEVEEMSFLSDWNRLRSVAGLGQGASLIVPERPNEEEEDASLFQDCFETGEDGTRPQLETWLKREYKDGRKEDELLQGLGLLRIWDVDADDVPESEQLSPEGLEKVWVVLKRKGDEVEY